MRGTTRRPGAALPRSRDTRSRRQPPAAHRPTRGRDGPPWDCRSCVRSRGGLLVVRRAAVILVRARVWAGVWARVHAGICHRPSPQAPRQRDSHGDIHEERQDGRTPHDEPEGVNRQAHDERHHAENQHDTHHPWRMLEEGALGHPLVLSVVIREPPSGAPRQSVRRTANWTLTRHGDCGIPPAGWAPLTAAIDCGSIPACQ